MLEDCGQGGLLVSYRVLDRQRSDHYSPGQPGTLLLPVGCQVPNVDVQPHPQGLKVVTEHGSGVNWRCTNGTWSTSLPALCKSGALAVRIRFPDCFDGDLSQEALYMNFRSNMAYAEVPPSGGPA